MTAASSGHEPPAGGGGDDGREPYEPPTIESEDLFEVVALSCGKINPTTLACIRVPKMS